MPFSVQATTAGPSTAATPGTPRTVTTRRQLDGAASFASRSGIAERSTSAMRAGSARGCMTTPRGTASPDMAPTSVTRPALGAGAAAGRVIHTVVAKARQPTSSAPARARSTAVRMASFSERPLAADASGEQNDDRAGGGERSGRGGPDVSFIDAHFRRGFGGNGVHGPAGRTQRVGF